AEVAQRVGLPDRDGLDVHPDRDVVGHGDGDPAARVGDAELDLRARPHQPGLAVVTAAAQARRVDPERGGGGPGPCGEPEPQQRAGGDEPCPHRAVRELPGPAALHLVEQRVEAGAFGRRRPPHLAAQRVGRVGHLRISSSSSWSPRSWAPTWGSPASANQSALASGCGPLTPTAPSPYGATTAAASPLS